MAAAGGIWGGRPAALAACRDSLPSVCPWAGPRVGASRGGAGWGAPRGEVRGPQAGRPVRAVGPGLRGMLGRRESSWRRTIGRIWGRRSRGALSECLRPDGGPQGGAEKLHPRPQAPAARAPPAARLQAGNAALFFDFLKESPRPPHLLWGWSGCVYGVGWGGWGGGRGNQPVPGVPLGGGVSRQKRRPPASVSPSVDEWYNFSDNGV